MKPQPLLLAAVLPLLTSNVQAQSVVAAPAVELRQFHGSPFSDRTLRLDGTNVLPQWKLSLGVDADYGFRPLVVDDLANGGRTTALVRHGVGLGLRAAVGLGHGLEIAALVPVTAYQAGDGLPGVAPPSTSGLEAVRLGLKGRVLGSGMAGPGLGASALVFIPTGSSGGLIREGFGAEGRVFGDLRTGSFTFAVGTGVRLRAATKLYDIPLGNELLLAAAAEYRLDESTTLFGELAGATALGSPFSSTKQSPLEVLFGGRQRIGGVTLFGGAGPGLQDGYGTPVLRLVAGLSFTNAPLHAEGAAASPEPDRDGDGLPDARDKCPDAAEDKDGFEDADGCPDLDDDKDGVPDAKDKCPRQPETKNGFKDEDGCPDEDLRQKDTDKDGLTDDKDKCVDQPEDKDGFEDEDGCPDPDNDKDGFPDAKDKCPNEPETINNVKDDDGCPDKGIVVLKEGELETLAPIFFASDRARVRHAFRPALNDIAAILISHPEIGRCAVEGHTDARGPADWNKKLSFERAKSVAAYLIAKGVDPARVVAIGQGDALPWATNQTEAGRAANRRVIFHIEGVSEDQEQKQLELQKQRALKEHGTEAHTP
jgi:outer membrane protein OmpA-like peptidoglycan-associated protein